MPSERPPTPPSSLEAHLKGRTDLSESVVEVSGKSYRLTHPSVPDDLIDEQEFDEDERLPYWAEIWPSAIALARHLSQEDLSGRRVVELGVGVGLPALVALDRGASVLATDYYAAAPDFTRHNAKQNGLPEPETALLNWHQTPDVGAFDLVIAADVMYEERSTRSLARLVPELLEPEGAALFADPGRRYEPLFRELMQENGFSFETEETTVELEGRERGVTVLLHLIRHQ